MQVNIVKLSTGQWLPASDYDAERLKRFSVGDIYPIDIKRARNPKFHGKVFKFFQFCFEYWRSDRDFMDESGQFDCFRKDLTIQAGYFNTYYGLDGAVRVEAKSLSYASMEQSEFEECYSALINAAMKNIFPGCGPEIENRLLSFF